MPVFQETAILILLARSAALQFAPRLRQTLSLVLAFMPPHRPAQLAFLQAPPECVLWIRTTSTNFETRQSMAERKIPDQNLALQ